MADQSAGFSINKPSTGAPADAQQHTMLRGTAACSVNGAIFTLFAYFKLDHTVLF